VHWNWRDDKPLTSAIAIREQREQHILSLSTLLFLTRGMAIQRDSKGYAHRNLWPGAKRVERPWWIEASDKTRRAIGFATPQMVGYPLHKGDLRIRGTIPTIRWPAVSVRLEADADITIEASVRIWPLLLDQWRQECSFVLESEVRAVSDRPASQQLVNVNPIAPDDPEGPDLSDDELEEGLDELPSDDMCCGLRAIAMEVGLDSNFVCIDGQSKLLIEHRSVL
jgi:hypothetical protein